MTVPVAGRVCRECLRGAPEVAMVRREAHPSGLATICRPCAAAASRRRYAANVEAERARNVLARRRRQYLALLAQRERLHL